jgi:hypothetical protein
MKPDELYAMVAKAIKERPQLLIVKGDEAERRLQFAVFDHVMNRKYYFEFGISHDDKESCIRFTTCSLEVQEELTKVTAFVLRNIMEHFSTFMIHRSGRE